MVREKVWVLSFAYPLVWFYGQTETSHEYLLHSVNILNDTIKEPTSSLSCDTCLCAPFSVLYIKTLIRNRTNQ